jgi:hypothetical protein
VEFVLSLTGATTGSLLCYIWPSLLILYAGTKLKENRSVAIKVFLALGIFLFFVCTLAIISKYHPTNNELIETIGHRQIIGI